jgi:hypothetical protein
MLIFLHFNWGSLVLNVLIASIREYKVLKAANLKGNLALLQVCTLYSSSIYIFMDKINSSAFLISQVWYWEKLSLSHKYPTLEHPARDKPLMQYWDEDKAKEQCKLAHKHPRGEGKVILIFLFIKYNCFVGNELSTL